jgi:hypothetical protein
MENRKFPNKVEVFIFFMGKNIYNILQLYRGHCHVDYRRISGGETMKPRHFSSPKESPSEPVYSP